jgi:predicted nucleic acid-binding protein
MIVYVETNFIIELARMQSQHAGCEGVLSLAEANRIRLVIPAYVMEESFGVWVRKRRVRTDITTALRRERRYLSESERYRDLLASIDGVNNLFTKVTNEEKHYLHNGMGRVLNVTTVIPLTQDIIISAMLYQDTLNLSPQDSIVYAAVISDLRRVPEREPKCFLNKNHSDFKKPVIIRELKKHGCKLMINFNEGLEYINRQI